MKSRAGGAMALLSLFLFLSSNGHANAQSAGGGFLDTLKGMAKDPTVRSLVLSKISNSMPQRLNGMSSQPVYTQQAGLVNAVANAVKQKVIPSAALPFMDPSALSNSSAYNNLLPAVSRLTNPQNLTSAPYSNPYFAAPNSGYYSFEEGARLGGVGYSADLPARANQNNTFGMASFSQHLQPAELQRLSKYDISVLIDKSGSMATVDCPDPLNSGKNISRWNWCQAQSSLLFKQTQGALPAGITIVPFANGATRFQNVSPAAINTIFKSGTPTGSTNLALALKTELDRYFIERDSGMRPRPLMLAVITDGVPDSKSAVRKVLQEAAMKMHAPDELKLCFYLIGNDQSGLSFISELSDDLAGNEMSENMVSSRSFWEVNQSGLARSLASSAIALKQ